MIKLSRQLLRFFLLLSHLFWGLILALIAFSPWLRSKSPENWPDHIVTQWSRRLCRILHLQVTYHGMPATTGTLLVANHISWLDIFALLSIFRVVFVAKQEIEEWPLLGWLVRRVGTLFIRRGRFEASTLAHREIVDALAQGTAVLFFPEGKATDGTQVYRFHARLFESAIQARVPVQPIALRYPHGEEISTIAPYTDLSFLAHVWRLVGEPELKVEIWFCPIITSVDKKRRDLAESARQQIEQVLIRKL
jgi:1-acyl-sn-glycerol-3-phosphate acyltransferase